MEKTRIAGFCRCAARAILLAVFAFWTVFSVLSGFDSEAAWLNLPNALPWIILLAVIIIAWKNELYGSILAAIAAIAAFFFFSGAENPVIIFAVSLPILIPAILLFISWRLRRQS